MEQLLKEMLEQYNLLLKYYEEMYKRFLAADCTKIDEYLKTIDDARSYIAMISSIQTKIENCRNELKKDIHNELLIDSVVDAYSDGQFSILTDRIEDIVESIRQYEEQAKSALGNEMDKIQYDLDEIGLDEKYVKLVSKLSSTVESNDKN